MWPVGVVGWRTWLWGAPEEIILTHLYLLNSHQALGQTRGKKVNGPQVALSARLLARVCRIPGRVPTPAAWRERGKGTLPWLTGSLPAQCQLGLH